MKKLLLLMLQGAAFVFVFAFFGLLPYNLHAQQYEAKGTWSINRVQSDDISGAIERAIRQAAFVTRPILRGRLRRTNFKYSRLIISYDEQNMSIQFDNRPSLSCPTNGIAVMWNREQGGTCPSVNEECVEVTTKWQNGRLEQTFRAEDGQRVNLLDVSPDGTILTMNVTVTSPRLPEPLIYKLVFNRAS